MMGVKQPGSTGETTRLNFRGETSRGETTRGGMVWGRNILLPSEHTECNGGSLLNVLILVSFEDLLHQYSWFKIHALGREL